MTSKEKFAEAIRLLDKGDVTAAGDLIIELGPFFRYQMKEEDSDYLIIQHPAHPNRQFIVHDEGHGPYLASEPPTIDLSLPGFQEIGA